MSVPRGEVALFSVFPRMAEVPWVRLGDWPTPIQQLTIPGRPEPLWVKRDDLSADVYGGNKVRTLEALFGEAQARGARIVWATGAVGSNHALATALHAPRAGLEAGAMLFPQPCTACARDNLVATLASCAHLQPLLHWSQVPFAVLAARSRPGSYVMVPGGATPTGGLGYVSAAFELAGQIRAGDLPLPGRLVVGVGSNCTSAGLLAGLYVAWRRGLLDAMPTIWSVRVTPWPVTSSWRIVRLAVLTSRLLARLAGDDRLAASPRDLAPYLRVVRGYLGSGYGHVTPTGLESIDVFAAAGGPPLDTCYSAKAASAALRPGPEPTLFWSTKSSRPLPGATSLDDAAARFRRWLGRPLLPLPEKPGKSLFT